MYEVNEVNIGILNEISGYTAKIIINKDEAPKPIYPIYTPMPIYVKDQEGNYFLIYEQNLIAPSSDLPSLNILSETGVITLDPAKHFILKSTLSSFQCSAVLITENAIPQLLSDINLIALKDVVNCWKEYGFNHLKLSVELLGSEKFKIFMRVFRELFGEAIKNETEIQKSLIKVLVEIGNNKGFNDTVDYLEILESFMSVGSVALILDNRMS